MFNPEVFTQVKSRLNQWASDEKDNTPKANQTTREVCAAALNELNNAEMNINNYTAILDHHKFTPSQKGQLFSVLLNAKSTSIEIKKITSEATPFSKLANIYTIQFEEGEPEQISEGELATFGNFFKTLVNTSMKETDKKIITLNAIEKEDFELIRSFFKGTNVDFKDPEKWLAASYLADYYQIEELKNALPATPKFESIEDAITFTLENEVSILDLSMWQVADVDIAKIHSIAQANNQSVSHIKKIKLGKNTLITSRLVNALPRTLEDFNISTCQIDKSTITSVFNIFNKALPGFNFLKLHN